MTGARGDSGGFLRSPASLLVLLIGALARFARLGHEGLWCDEGFTALTIQKPIGRLIADLAAKDDAPPLFYLLAKSLAAVMGNSEAALRLVPALAGVAAVALLLHLAHRRREPAYFWAAAFFAIAPVAVFYARQARDYGLLLLLALGFIVSSGDALFRRGRYAAARLIATGALLPLTHHVAAILILTSLLAWPLGSGRRPGLLRWIGYHAAAVLPWGIWWVSLGAGQLQAHAEMNAWISTFWSRHPQLLGPVFSLAAFVPGVTPGSPLQVALASLAFRPAMARVVGGLLSTAAIGVACWHAARSASPRNGSREVAVEWLFLAAPLVGLTLISALGAPAYIVGRTDTIGFAGFTLVIGRGLAKLPRAVAGTFTAIWTALAVSALAATYGLGAPGEAKSADRDAARGLAQAGLRRDDILVHDLLTAPSLEYYLDRYGVRHSATWFPPLAEQYPAAVIPVSLDSLEAYSEDARVLRARIDAELPEGGAVWLLAREEPSVAREALRAAAEPTFVRNSSPREFNAQSLLYPMNVLVYHLVGTSSIRPVIEYRQDWMGATIAVFRLERSDWADPENLSPVIAAGKETR